MRVFAAKFLLCSFAILFTITASGQTTEFTYQGSLQNSSAPASGNFDFEFLLYDAVSGGSQIGSTLTRTAVAVSTGTFAVKLDFGSQFPGPNRFLEIHVRPNGGSGFTPLTPRQSIGSSPYSIQSLNAATSTNAAQLGGVAAGQYVVTTDPRMTDGRNPIAGSSNYIQNQNAGAQGASNFNISGDGFAGGTLSGTVVNAVTQYNIGGNPALVVNGSTVSPHTNIFAGIGAGVSITPGGFFNYGTNNSFYGSNAGNHTTTAVNSSFFGADAGFNNLGGSDNNYFGYRAGYSNLTGGSNSFFGHAAGILNTASSNSFFGFVAGQFNSTGQNNTFIGSNAGNPDTSTQVNHSTAIGSDATVSASNTIVLGTATETTQVPGGLTVGGNGTAGGTLSGNVVNSTTQYNIGGSRVLSVPGTEDTFTGVNAGSVNTGTGNSFFGMNAGASNTSGSGNSYFGDFAGYHSGFVMTGGFNSAFGGSAGQFNTNGSNNTSIGYLASAGGSQGQSNATAVGVSSQATSTYATAFGSNASAPGGSATAIGASASAAGNSATAIGTGASASGISTTAIGAGATATVAHTIYIGTSAETTIVPGYFSVGTLGTAGGSALCLNNGAVIAYCSSSMRYKTHISKFSQGMSFIKQLRPISFDWKDGGMKDVGFGAEDIAKIDRRFVTYNAAGEVEGVKYDRLSVAFVNAFMEQQTQIEAQQDRINEQQSLIKKQQTEIDALKATTMEVEALKRLVCSRNPKASACKSVY